LHCRVIHRRPREKIWTKLAVNHGISNSQFVGLAASKIKVCEP
jgi:hypothetical protein